jgi:hypothetical protein
MKALTLTQPYASLMAARQKTIETRSWWTGYRGDLVIHAAKGFPRWAKDLCEDAEFAKALDGRTAAELPLSVGVCIVRVVGCVRTDSMDSAAVIFGHKLTASELLFGDYYPGRYAWLTEYVRPLDNVGPVRGSLGLWNWAESDQVKAEDALLRGEARL